MFAWGYELHARDVQASKHEKRVVKKGHRQPKTCSRFVCDREHGRLSRGGISRFSLVRCAARSMCRRITPITRIRKLILLCAGSVQRITPLSMENADGRDSLTFSKYAESPCCRYCCRQHASPGSSGNQFRNAKTSSLVFDVTSSGSVASFSAASSALALS